eukprot:CAMPEP_0202920344 /NCGR_PEP_ID=MMETSP1392-20130828/76808_1 /ASSEMBLY_ACC=CAM_ASM_000868 /TAXON_ID=225041 /ORGANISM="Chlamydomonas chlamydogama, Strain SAG 11-48b" /LENGTH=47 /DNA_ID= /DNA_START= /DNA_END= /DNA_ORIENTATION=
MPPTTHRPDMETHDLPNDVEILQRLLREERQARQAAERAKQVADEQL